MDVTALALALLCGGGVLLGGPVARDLTRRSTVRRPSPAAEVEPRRLGAAAALAIVTVGVGIGSPLLVGPAAVTAAASGLVADTVRARRRARRARQQITALVDGLSRSVRSGATVAAALAEAGRDGGVPLLEPDLRVVRDEVAAGRPLLAALDGWSDRSEDADLRLLTGTVAVLTATGGSAAPALDATARTIRARAGAAAEVRALAAQARASALVLVVAPVVFAVVLASVDPRLGAFLLRDGRGAVCASVAIALDGLGLWWMQRIIDRSEP